MQLALFAPTWMLLLLLLLCLLLTVLLPGQNAKTYFIIAAGYRAAASMYNLLQKAELIILIGQPREVWGKVYAPPPPTT